MWLKEAFIVGIPALLAIAAASVAIRSMLSYRRLSWVRATAVGAEIGVDSEGGPLYRTRFEYAVSGEKYEILDEMSFGWRAHKTGDQVWIGYTPDTPKSGRVWRVWPALVASVLFIAACAVLWLVVPRTRA